jgi:hypothetical protein
MDHIPPRRSLSRRVGAALTVAGLSAGAAAVARVAAYVRTQRAEVRAFQEAHAPARIVGKTADEVIAAYGPPFIPDRTPGRPPTLLIYKQPSHGQYCAIALKDGVAVQVSFSFQ